MSRAADALSAPFRLVRAMRSQGVRPVASFVVRTLTRRGAVDALRLGLADRAHREQVAEDDLAHPPPPSAPGGGRALRLVSAPYRLARAMRAEGVGPVVSFLVITVRRRGALGALKLGLADRSQPEPVPASRNASAPPPPTRRREPQDLDEDYGMDGASWTLWGPRVGSTAASADPYDDAFADAAVSFLVRPDDAGDDKALARTRAAIARLGATLEPARAPARPSPRPAEQWVVFLRAGDLPSAELARELARATRTGVAEVATFDLLRREAERVFPLLAPGANPTPARRGGLHLRPFRPARRGPAEGCRPGRVGPPARGA